MIGDNIKKYRLAKNMTQEQLASQLNMVRQTVSKWEKNLSIPDADTISKISEILDVTVNQILGIEEEQTEVTEDIDVDKVYEQLMILNETIAKLKKFAGKLKQIILVLLIVIVLIAIWPSWTEMWYEFGQNLYHWTH